jgi:hypothetical protein
MADIFDMKSVRVDEVLLLCLMDSLTILSLMESLLNKSRKKIFCTEPHEPCASKDITRSYTPHHTTSQQDSHPNTQLSRQSHAKTQKHKPQTTLALDVRDPVARLRQIYALHASSGANVLYHRPAATFGCRRVGEAADHPDPLLQQAKIPWSNIQSLDRLS